MRARSMSGKREARSATWGTTSWRRLLAARPACRAGNFDGPLAHYWGATQCRYNCYARPSKTQTTFGHNGNNGCLDSKLKIHVLHTQPSEIADAVELPSLKKERAPQHGNRVHAHRLVDGLCSISGLVHRWCKSHLTCAALVASLARPDGSWLTRPSEEEAEASLSGMPLATADRLNGWLQGTQATVNVASADFSEAVAPAVWPAGPDRRRGPRGPSLES